MIPSGPIPKGPGATLPGDSKVVRNPHDISTWGPECGRGHRYENKGQTVAGRQNEHKISGRRKRKR